MALLILLGILAALLSLQPRHFPILEKKLESALSDALSPHKVEAERVLLGMEWIPWPHLVVQTENVVVSKAERTVARFPALELELSLIKLLHGQLVLSHVELKGATLALRVMPDGAFSLGFEAAPEASDGLQTPGEPVDLSRLRLRSVHIDEARLIIMSPGGVQNLSLPVMEFKQKDDVTRLHLSEGEAASPAMLDLEITPLQAQPGKEFSVKLSHFRMSPLLQVLPQLSTLHGLELTIDGQIIGELSPENKLKGLNVSLQGKNGRYENKDILPEPLTIQAFKGGMTYQDGHYTLAPSELSFEGVIIKLAGTMQEENPGMSGDLLARVANLPLNDLYRYWPLMLAPETRRWVTTHIRDGMTPEGTVRFRFTPQDLAAPTLPDHCVDADLAVSQATIHYMDHLPPVEKLDANVHITGETLTATASSGQMLSETRIKQGEISIPNFNDLTTPVNLALQLTTVAPDVALMLDPAHLNLASSLQLDASTLQGSGKGTLKLGIIIYPEEAGPVQDVSSIVNYNIDAELMGASQKGLLGKWDVENLNGHFIADNASLSLDATGKLQGVNAHINVRQEHASGLSVYSLESLLPAGKLAAFGIKAPEGISGVVGVKAQVEERPGIENIKATFDLSQTDLLLNDLAYRKATGLPGLLELHHIARPGQPSEAQFSYRAGDENVEGRVWLDEAEKIIKADLPIVRFNGHDFQALYQRDPDGLHHVRITGAQLNASPWTEAQAASASENDDDWMENLDLEIDLGRLLMGAGRDFNSARGHMTCPGNFCQSASLSAQTSAGKPLQYKIFNKDGGRHLSILAEDAGELLRVLEIAQHVRDGTLEVFGQFDDTQSGRPLNASVLMKDFALDNAPALTKLLTLLSLTGLRDTVSGNGIRFTKLSGDVTYMHDDLIINKAKAYGPALGVTLEGEIANDGAQLALTGTLVPSYTANSLVGKIPLIGKALVGGEGEGVFAARFSIKGPTTNPDVGVNPLSLLTPGFLRNLFEIAESPKANRVAEEDKKPKLSPAPVDATESVE
jgi:hypothetical protein